MGAEGLYCCGTCAVYERDTLLAAPLNQSIEDRDHGRDPYAGGEKNNGAIIVVFWVQKKVTDRMRKLHNITDVLLLMHHIRDVARVCFCHRVASVQTVLLLNADAIVVMVWRIAQGKLVTTSDSLILSTILKSRQSDQPSDSSYSCSSRPIIKFANCPYAFAHASSTSDIFRLSRTAQAARIDSRAVGRSSLPPVRELQHRQYISKLRVLIDHGVIEEGGDVVAMLL
ncbi:hypothetical protein KC341_g42 [Hortaea werneckii]|nr:hypothetical protein KC341_g42 [Hortaea werneckii]